MWPDRAARFQFSAYGLQVHSSIELPGLRLAAAAGAADVTVDVGQIAGLQEVASGDWYRLAPQSSTLVKAGVGAIDIRDARRITVQIAPGAERELAHYLLGPGMGLLLQQRGYYCLHASCVRIGDSAVAIAGDSGAGKSTLAHALLAAGHALVTDDIVAVDASGPVPMALPGHGALRLTPQHLTRIGLDPEHYEVVHAATDKRLLPLDATTCVQQPLPLSRIYLLQPGTTPAVEEVTGLARALAILRHAFYPTLQSGVAGADALLQRCVHIAENVRVFHLRRGDDLTALGDLTALLE